MSSDEGHAKAGGAQSADVVVAPRKKGQYELRCKQCHELVSDGSFLRTIQGVRCTTVDPTIAERIILRPQPAPQPFHHDFEIDCKKCNKDWGFTATYNEVVCCLFDLENIVVVEFGKHDKHKLREYAKWREFPFVIDGITAKDSAILIANTAALQQISPTAQANQR
jgi:hypothetical protein